MDDRRRTALITGASAGIGWAFAEVFAEQGFDLVVVARRRQRLERLAEEVARRWEAHTTIVTADLGDPSTPGRVRDVVASQGGSIDALVNNAGYGIRGAFLATPWHCHAEFLSVMMTSVAHLCHLFAPGMRERGFGRIVNVASIAAFAPDAPGSLYGGSKIFVVRLSRALALELAGTGVHVTALCPGFTHTEFHDVMGIRHQVRRVPGFLWMDARTVAKQGYAAVGRNTPVYVNGALNRIIRLFCAALPGGLAHRLLARRLAVRRRDVAS